MDTLGSDGIGIFRLDNASSDEEGGAAGSVSQRSGKFGPQVARLSNKKPIENPELTRNEKQRRTSVFASKVDKLQKLTLEDELNMFIQESSEDPCPEEQDVHQQHDCTDTSILSTGAEDFSNQITEHNAKDEQMQLFHTENLSLDSKALDATALKQQGEMQRANKEEEYPRVRSQTLGKQMTNLAEALSGNVTQAQGNEELDKANLVATYNVEDEAAAALVSSFETNYTETKDYVEREELAALSLQESETVTYSAAHSAHVLASNVLEILPGHVENCQDLQQLPQRELHNVNLQLEHKGDKCVPLCSSIGGSACVQVPSEICNVTPTCVQQDDTCRVTPESDLHKTPKLSDATCINEKKSQEMQEPLKNELLDANPPPRNDLDEASLPCSERSGEAIVQELQVRHHALPISEPDCETSESANECELLQLYTSSLTRDEQSRTNPVQTENLVDLPLIINSTSAPVVSDSPVQVESQSCNSSLVDGNCSLESWESQTFETTTTLQDSPSHLSSNLKPCTGDQSGAIPLEAQNASCARILAEEIEGTKAPQESQQQEDVPGDLPGAVELQALEYGPSHSGNCLGSEATEKTLLASSLKNCADILQSKKDENGMEQFSARGAICESDDQEGINIEKNMVSVEKGEPNNLKGKENSVKLHLEGSEAPKSNSCTGQSQPQHRPQPEEIVTLAPQAKHMDGKVSLSSKKASQVAPTKSCCVIS